MSAAVDANVLVRMLQKDKTATRQCAAARRLLAETEAAGETLFIPLCAPLETEWVLRSRYKVGRTAMVSSPYSTRLRISAHRGRHFRLIVDGISA
jgi:predicted nucleic-acid-binding protein